MQPPAMIHTAHSAARTARDLSRPRRDRIRGLAPGRALGFDRRDTLALLEGHRRLLHDRLAALQSSLDGDRGPEVATEHHLLKMQRGLCPHDRDPGALRVEDRSEEHTSELQSRLHLVCRLLLEKKKKNTEPSDE